MLQNCDVELSTHMKYALGNKYFTNALSLVEEAVNVNSISRDDKSALLRTAASIGKHMLVNMFLQIGADVNSTDMNGKTALINAAIWNQDKCVNLLIEGGADVNIATNQGDTALMFANCSNMKSLLKAGADVNAVNSQGTTALM